MKTTTMSTPVQNNTTVKRTFWAAAIFYMLIAFEFFYMASPFAIYFYSVYRPGLEFLNSNPTLAWLSSTFLPHIVVETNSLLVNSHNVVGAVLAIFGFLAFCIGAGQVYYYKLTRKGAVTGGIYNIIRHPQYASLVICSFGLLLLWPRFIVLFSFVTMLFAYYFLAKVEENECEQKFGQSYIDYKNSTNMFLPFRIPFVDKLPGLPKAGLKRYAAMLTMYVMTLLAAIGVANGLQELSFDSMYALYTKDAAYLSVAKVEDEKLERIVNIAMTNPEVQARLENGAKYINYVLPAEWHVSEIPMNPVEGGRGHYMPSEYDNNSYKIVFTKAALRTGEHVEGAQIPLNTVKRVPIVEVWVDVAHNQVTDIKNPPENITYEGIPVPVY